jgi:hypothetical protein
MVVQFIEKGHKYLNELGKPYTSATTLIGKYKEPFDGEYWSMYKAVQRLVEEEHNEYYFQQWKGSIGYKNVINTFVNEADEATIEKLKTTQEVIKKEWEYEKNIACFNGSNFHKAKEDGWLAKPEHYEGVIKRQWYTTGVQDMSGKNISPEDLPDGVYSELVLWNHFYEIAGQADIVYIETVDGVRYIDIDDYKTNKKIDETSYQNPRTKKYKMMQKPLGTVMDCNHGHYSLQLSLYAWMLEQFGFKVRNINFQHWNNVGTKEEPHYEFNRDFPISYLGKEIKKMLDHYHRTR